MESELEYQSRYRHRLASEGLSLVLDLANPRWQARSPKVPPEIRDLIRMLSRNNPLWGAPRIHGELLKLGIEITEPTVAKYMVQHRKLPSQTWRTFLENYMKTMVSVDFFTVPTIRFKILYVFIVVAWIVNRVTALTT